MRLTRIMAGLASLAISVMATAPMANIADVDVLLIDLQPDVGIYQLSLLRDEVDLMQSIDVLVTIDVVSDGLAAAAIDAFQTVSLADPMATRGGASDLMVEDAMRLWRTRTIDAFTVSPDILI
jgi:hypothetical protein